MRKRKEGLSSRRGLPISEGPGLYLTKSPEATFALGEALGRSLKSGVIALRGDLGSGKTLLAKGVACGLGIQDVKRDVISPTFTIIREYQAKIPFYHIDLYRVRSLNEVIELDLKRYFYSDGVTLVEWPDRCESFLPDKYVDIIIEILGLRRRRIRISGCEFLSVQGKT